MLELQMIAAGRAMPVFDLPSALGRAKAAREVGEAIDALLAFYDDLASDPDLEDNGDLEPDDDAKGDVSWSEWHTRGRNKLHDGVTNVRGRVLDEDEEHDDPDTGIEDDPRGCDPESDFGAEELGEMDEVEVDYRPIADREAYREQLNRIRDTRCDRIVREGRGFRYVEYRLREPHHVALGVANDLI